MSIFNKKTKIDKIDFTFFNDKLPGLQYVLKGKEHLFIRNDIEWEIEEDEKIYCANSTLIANSIYPFLEKYPTYVVKAFLEMLNTKELSEFNHKKLLLEGNPDKDYIQCTELGRLECDNDIFKYDSLYEFDYDWWNYQREYTFKDLLDKSKYTIGADIDNIEEETHKVIMHIERDFKNKYDIYLTGDWFRIIKDNKFYYANILSVKWFLFYQIEHYIEELYENNNDIKYYTDISNQALEIIETVISKNYSLLDGTIFILDEKAKHENDENNIDFIFFNSKSTKKVSFNSFLKDIDNNTTDYNVLENILDIVKNEIKIIFK